MWWILIVACADKTLDAADSGTKHTGVVSGADSAQSDDSGYVEPPKDIDGDGSAEDVDCDDRDPTVYPGAEETWNDVDDDCDGVIDADGAYTGTMELAATAIYEGDPYSFSLTCPLTADRSHTKEGEFMSFEVVCVPEDEKMAQLLLGSQLVLFVADEEIDEASWDGRVDVVSSSGWDTYADGVLTWQSLTDVTQTISLETVSLALSGSASWSAVSGTKR